MAEMGEYQFKSKPEMSVDYNRGLNSGAKTLEDNRPNSIFQRKTNNTGLPNNLKSGIENLSGVDMSDTKVHYNSSKPAQLNAHAYAQGTEIHVASGQEKHLPHEAWHVVQQKQGRVRPTMQLKGKVAVNDDEGLEREADIMGVKALQMKTQHASPYGKKVSGITSYVQKKSTNKDVIQRFYVNSYYLKFGDVSPEPEPDGKMEMAASSSSMVEDLVEPKHNSRSIEYSKNFSGPWEVCNDTTNKGYRTRADEELGGRGALTVLARFGVIMAGASKKHSYTLSHLIAAEFAGQIKYRDPKENIRYFPNDLEYGAWQESENQLKRVGKMGRLHVIGSDESLSTVFQMSDHIVHLVGHIFSGVQRAQIGMKLDKILMGAQYVPKNVTFDYKDYGGGEDVKMSAGGLSAGLRVNGGADLGNVLKALKVLGVLPESDKDGTELHIETTESGTKNTMGELQKMVDGFKIKSARRKTIINGINRLITMGVERGLDLPVVLKGYIDKLPEMSSESKTVNIGIKVFGQLKL